MKITATNRVGKVERQMQSLRELLPESLWKSMIGKLGREEALHRLWPAVVGKRLASQTQIRRIRGTTLFVAVPDLQWSRSLQPLEELILEAVNRLPGSWRAEAIEFIAEPGSDSMGDINPPATLRKPPGTADAPDSERASILELFARSEKKYFARQ